MKTKHPSSSKPQLASHRSSLTSQPTSHISHLLIANRGEISTRISRTCKEMGITSIAVYSDADRSAPFVKDADIAIHIGASQPNHSYLNQNKIIEAAKQIGAQAIHPGYGFLSENAGFAKRCRDEGIIFIGPNTEAIEKMGSKSKAKQIMHDHDVPIIPGYNGKDQSIHRLVEESNKIGYPVLLKASAGGGGRGMRIVHDQSSMENAIQSAKRESKKAFCDDQLIIEKYIEEGRHLEVQIFGDQLGNIVHLYERECSIQRRYQKIIEESPSPIVDDSLRYRLTSAALKAAKALDYDNAGTVEFIYEEKSGAFYFLEVNTRLQVEHPVTEAITGLDLVRMQIESAQGLPLTLLQSDIKHEGYAIEVRLYAEDPDNNFIPMSGEIIKFKVPITDGLRVETTIISGSVVSIYYDPMIAKIIMHGKNRHDTIRKLNYVLRNTICLGIKTNLSYLIAITEDLQLAQGNYNTLFTSNFKIPNSSDVANSDLALIACSISDWIDRDSSRTMLRHIPSGWRNNFYEPPYDIFIDSSGKETKVSYTASDRSFSYTVDKKQFQIEIIDRSKDTICLEIGGLIRKFTCCIDNDIYYVHNPMFGNISLRRKKRFEEFVSDNDNDGYITSMPAQVIKIMVEPNQIIEKGERLIVLSSMKMESVIVAHEDGVVGEVYVVEGQNVESGVELVRIE